MKINKLLIFIIGIVLLVNIVYATSDLPPGLLKAKEYNKELAQDILQNVSFFIAFLAGLTSILSPCILPLLPAYFAVTFKEKKNITLATFLFFFGFTVIFIVMGLLATLAGKILISVFRGINWLVPVAGIFLILFGIMVFFGKGFSGFFVKRRFRDDSVGIIVLGVAFAIGWTACIGPILSGVLIMTSTFGNYLTSSYLMFAYSLGIFVPLFFLSFFYDRTHLDRLTCLKKEVMITIKGKKFYTNYPNIVAGVLFAVLGLVFVIFRGTWIINGLQMFGLRTYFYSLQNLFLENVKIFNVIGFVVFIIFAAILFYFLVREIKNNKEQAMGKNK